MSMSFTVTVTATDNGGFTGAASATEMVNDRPPIATITSVAPNPANTGQTVTVMFTATDPDGTMSSIMVTWGDGTSTSLAGTATSATHSYANTGNALSENFTITVTATDNSGSTGSASASETINDRPPVAVIASPSSAPVNTSVTFDGTGSTDPDGTVVAWAWTFGDGTTGTGSVVTHSYSTTGTFNVTLTVTDNSGNTGVATTQITITAPTTVAHASLTHHKAFPSFHHLAESKHPNETFNAIVVNDGNVTTNVFVSFHITGDSGVNTVLNTTVTSLAVGQLVTLSVNYPSPNLGSYSVTATLYYLNPNTGQYVASNTKTFSFTALA